MVVQYYFHINNNKININPQNNPDLEYHKHKHIKKTIQYKTPIEILQLLIQSIFQYKTRMYQKIKNKQQGKYRLSTTITSQTQTAQYITNNPHIIAPNNTKINNSTNSNNNRRKYTSTSSIPIGARFNTLNTAQSYEGRSKNGSFNYGKNGISNKIYIPIPGGNPRPSRKQSRRYSESSQPHLNPVHNPPQSRNLPTSTPNISVKQPHLQYPSSIMLTQPNLEPIIDSDKFIEQLQKEKNRRIQEIYNPQAISRTISVVRNKNVGKGRLLLGDKLTAGQLDDKGKDKVRSRDLSKRTNQDSRLLSQERQTRKSHKDNYLYNSIKNSNSNALNIIISSSNIRQKDRSRPKLNNINQNMTQKSVPKILPVTFQKMQRLSTINQKTQSAIQRNNRINSQFDNSKHNANSLNTKHQHSQPLGSKHTQNTPTSYQDGDPDLVSIDSKTPNSQNLPFPKFNNFFDSYQSKNQLQSNGARNKTYLFKNRAAMGGSKGDHEHHCQESQVVVNHMRNKGARDNKERIKELTIFNQLDKAALRVIKDSYGVYYGEINASGLKQGKGAIFYNNGKVFQGQFKNNQKNGMGSQTFVDGSNYTGQYKNGNRNGKGRFQWPNGEIYDGQWQNNLKHGSGLWETKNSLASYIGEWNHGNISGFGVLTNQKGQRYQGQFLNFSKQGHGAYRFQNGDRIVGNFKRNQPNGQCEYFWQNGDFYKGDFVNGLRHGRGIVKYVDGSFYQGQFRNDKKCGLGKQHYCDGIIYYGNFQNDLRHGFGKIVYGDVIYYEGYWINNIAVIFQEESFGTEQILEDEKQRLASGLSNNFSSNKLKKLSVQDQQKILKSMRSRAMLKKSKIQKFSSQNLLQRLCQPKKRCKCLLKH